VFASTKLLPDRDITLQTLNAGFQSIEEFGVFLEANAGKRIRSWGFFPRAAERWLPEHRADKQAEAEAKAERAVQTAATAMSWLDAGDEPEPAPPPKPKYKCEYCNDTGRMKNKLSLCMACERGRELHRRQVEQARHTAQNDAWTKIINRQSEPVKTRMLIGDLAIEFCSAEPDERDAIIERWKGHETGVRIPPQAETGLSVAVAIPC
jgi:hypothetical protein